MKLSFSTLPFVKSSKTVSREEVKDISPHSNKTCLSETNELHRQNQVTFRRVGNKTIKRAALDIDLLSNLPSCIEELSPPSKLRKKYKIASENSKTFKKNQGIAITEHIATLKRKQLAMHRIHLQNSPESSLPNQEVPVSPSLEDIMPLDFQDTNMKTFPQCSIPNQLQDTFIIGKTTEQPTDNERFTKTPTVIETATTQSSIDCLPFSLPIPSPPLSISKPQFNPQTFSIGKIFPREE